MKTQTVFGIIISLILGTFIGYLLPHGNNSPLFNVLTTQSMTDAKPGLQIAYDRLMARGYANVAFVGYGFKESKNIGGIIQGIQGDGLTLQVSPVNALANPDLDSRIVHIGSDTKIYRLQSKTSSEIQKDMSLFEKKMQNMSGGISPTHSPEDFPIPPDSMKKIAMSIGDLKPTANIMVISKENIQDAKNINAIEIHIY